MVESVGAFIHATEGQQSGWIALASLGISESPQSLLYCFMMPIPMCLMVLLLTCFCLPKQMIPSLRVLLFIFLNHSLFNPQSHLYRRFSKQV